jgi:mRNA-degrading endonuclease RelE of RelBE toxin-antitoxin system
MNNYLPSLAIALTLNILMPPAIVHADSKTFQQAAIERFFLAEKLSPHWFSPASLKKHNLAELQKKRDELKARIKQRYGAYKSVQLIKETKYRIVFDNANPNMVIATFRFDSDDRIDGIDMEINPR